MYHFITTKKAGKTKSDDDDETNNDKSLNVINDENIRLFQSARSKTMPPSTLDKQSRKNKDMTVNKTITQNVNTDRLKLAKEEAERAIKVIFK